MWASLAQARVFWPDAPSDDVELESLLVAAHEVCAIYAPDLVDGVQIPERYVRANVLQAKDIYQAGVRAEGDVIGYGEYAIRARDLTAVVKGLLRPRQGYRVIG